MICHRQMDGRSGTRLRGTSESNLHTSARCDELEKLHARLISPRCVKPTSRMRPSSRQSFTFQTLNHGCHELFCEPLCIPPSFVSNALCTCFGKMFSTSQSRWFPFVSYLRRLLSSAQVLGKHVDQGRLLGKAHHMISFRGPKTIHRVRRSGDHITHSTPPPSKAKNTTPQNA